MQKFLSTVKRTRALALLSMLFMLLVSACGSSISGSSSASNSLLDQIKSRGYIKIGIAVDPPFTYQDATGQWTSMEPTMDRLLCQHMGVKCQFVAEGWTTILAGLLAGRYDIIGASMSATAERKKAIDFTIPLTYAGAEYVIDKSNPKNLTTLQSLNNPNVVIAFSQNAAESFITHDSLPLAQERGLTNASIADEIAEVESGHADADGLCSCLAAALAKAYPWARLVPPPNASGIYTGIGAVGVSWGVRKGDATFVSYLNNFISSEIKNATLPNLLRNLKVDISAAAS